MKHHIVSMILKDIRKQISDIYFQYENFKSFVKNITHRTSDSTYDFKNYQKADIRYLLSI